MQNLSTGLSNVYIHIKLAVLHAMFYVRIFLLHPTNIHSNVRNYYSIGFKFELSFFHLVVCV